MPKISLGWALAAALLLTGPSAGAAPLKPARHGDFHHYTFALTWQPGFCASARDCAPDSPRVLIGLHGLWASRPESLIHHRIAAPKWWARGCDFFHHSNRPPPIAPALRVALLAVMPHLPKSLLVHEYDKHVQCFGFDPNAFFQTELRMRQWIVDSAFGRHLKRQLAGQTVSHAALIEAFKASFHTSDDTALQLRCEHDARHHTVLTQLWITVQADRLQAFPGPAALMQAQQKQDNCPAHFLVPAWSP